MSRYTTPAVIIASELPSFLTFVHHLRIVASQVATIANVTADTDAEPGRYEMTHALADAEARSAIALESIRALCVLLGDDLTSKEGPLVRAFIIDAPEDDGGMPLDYGLRGYSSLADDDAG